MVRNRIIEPLLVIPFALACNVEDPQLEGDDDDFRLYGDATHTDCSAPWVGFNADILRYGRIAASTDAFEQCIDRSFRTGYAGGPYRSCAGEPFAPADMATKVARAIDMSRSPNDVAIDCTGGGGNASTGQNSGWGHTLDESFAWGGWFASVFAQLSLPVCAPGQSPPSCRFAAYPWPYSQAAGIVWHEASHTHGYSHGANDQTGAIAACGYAGDPTWHFQVNTAPYIIGNCVSQVIAESGTACGNIDSCPGDALLMVDDIGGTTCSCVADPVKTGFASIQLEGSDMVDVGHAATGSWYGSWNYSSLNDVVGAGDFDGDGRDEALMMSAWGMGILGRLTNGQLSSEAMHPAGTWIGGWNFGAIESIQAVGDFDADGADEFLIRSPWGIGLMQKVGNGFGLIWSAPYNTWIGNYFLRSGDRIVGVGRFSAANRDEILVQGSTGTIGILRLSGSTLTSASVNQPGQWMGGWNHGAGTTNTIMLPADYDGDGLDEFVIRSGWGMAILDRLASGALTTFEIEPHGTLLSEMFTAAPGTGWTLAATDQVVAAADMNTDGRAELVVRNGGGLGLLSVDTAGQWRTRTQFFHGSRFSGGWLFGGGDTIVAIGDYDGAFGRDLLLRSPWGVGVISLRANNYTLVTLGLEPYGSLLDSWLLKSGDAYDGNIDFDGDGAIEFVLRR